MENLEQDKTKIKCHECGKYFDFLAPHLSKTHQISTDEYKIKWKIPKHVPLSSDFHRNNCRINVKERIKKGEIDPLQQIELMRMAYAKSTKIGRSSQLAKDRASESVRQNKIWLKSPAIKIVSPELKKEAIRRMLERNFSKELVKDISNDLKISVSRLYAWIAKIK